MKISKEHNITNIGGNLCLIKLTNKSKYIVFSTTKAIQVDLVIRGLFIREFAYSHLKHWQKKAKFLVKMCLFISEFSIRGAKKRDLSTANNEVHLYLKIYASGIIWKRKKP